MCANRGKRRQDDYYGHGTRQTPHQNVSERSSYSNNGGDGDHTGGEVAGSGERWSYDHSQQSGPQFGHTNMDGNGGYHGYTYGGQPQGYGYVEYEGYQGQHAHQNYSAYEGYQQPPYQQYNDQQAPYQQYGDGYSNYGRSHEGTYGNFQAPFNSTYGGPGGSGGYYSGGGYSNYNPQHENSYSSYSSYRQDATQGRREQVSPVYQQQSRGYASHTTSRPVMTTTDLLAKIASIRPKSRWPSPPPSPARTEPTDEYLAVTLQPSLRVGDPSSARKLVVLDLNGSLLLRSAHKSRTLPRHGGSDPYANPTQLRPLRAVHRRPYLTAFTSYILHDQTKEWLDTMVWSSAQPHSVDDMVDRCFGERRSELRAVWARDTLGLAATDYHKKSITLKNLEKPWAELPYYSTSQSTSREGDVPAEVKGPEAQHHSALSTVLVDDSPVKAALQPWNHLVIHEYLQGTRNLDLKVVEWEEAKERMEKTRRDIEALETAGEATEAPLVETDAVISHADGETPDVAKHPSSPTEPSNLDSTGELEPQSEQPGEGAAPADEEDFVANQKRKIKRLAKKERSRQEREEKEREAFAALQQHQEESKAERIAPAQENGQVSADFRPATSVEAPKRPAVELRYDETLLAVVGILDHLKHESNVSGWMRSGGLINTALSSQQTPLQPSTKHSAPSRGWSPSELAGPPKKRRVGSSPDVAHIDTDVLPSLDSSSPTATEPPLSQVSVAPDSSPPPSEEQAETGVPLSSPLPTVPSIGADDLSQRKKEVLSTSGRAGLWYENKEVMNYWSEQGRIVLAGLGIEADSGMR